MYNIEFVSMIRALGYYIGGLFKLTHSVGCNVTNFYYFTVIMDKILRFTPLILADMINAWEGLHVYSSAYVGL